MTYLNWRSINPEDRPMLWFSTLILGWFVGPGLMVGAGRQLTLHGGLVPPNVLLFGVGVLATAIAIGMVGNSWRGSGDSADGGIHSHQRGER